MKPASGVRIAISKNGPYFVDGRVPFTVEAIVPDAQGESEGWKVVSSLDDHERCGLCRCGESKIKPLCDGSHVRADFDGAETAPHGAYDELSTVVEGPRVTLADQKDLCADARFCHRRGTVWHRVLDDTDEAAAVVVEESRLCPSGRYTAIDSKTGEPNEPQFAPSIAFIQDIGAAVSGPIWVRGGIEIEGADGEPYEVRNRVTLCRCGQSKNKPFCDGSHIEHGFHDHL